MTKWPQYLRRSVGTAGTEDHLLKDIIYSKNFRAFLGYAGRALCGANLYRAREMLSESLLNMETIGADAHVFDESRVFKKECCG